MPVRSADATWEGTLQDGEGSVALESGAFEGSYSFASRFQDGTGTNPEELIAAAEAGCFAMALSLMLQENGFEPERIDATADVTLEEVDDDFVITEIHLTVDGIVPDISADEFVDIATQAKEGCPVSKALAGPEITMEASLG